MATVTKTMSRQEIADLHKRLAPHIVRETRPAYTEWSVKTSEMSVTAYTSGKVVFQGKNLSWMDDQETPAKATSPKARSVFPQAGSDEVGTGDFLGPVVVAAAIVENEEVAKHLDELKVTDSKAMSDEAIRKVGPILLDLLPHSILVLGGKKYNAVYHPQTMNLNKIKAWMHNQVYLSLMKKGYALPDLCVVDQFCQPSTYYRYLSDKQQVYSGLTFQTKAESAYPAVAAASVLARYAFLLARDALEEKAGMTLAKGGGAAATRSAKQLKEKFGRDALSDYAKLHFSNTSKI